MKALEDLALEQTRLEQRMARLGVDKFRDAYERWTRAGRATDVNSVQVAMRSAIAPMVEAIEAFREEAKPGKAGRRHSAVRLLAGMESYIVAFFTIKIVMDGLIRSQELTPLAVKLGGYLEVEKNSKRLSELKGVDGNKARWIINFLTEDHRKRNGRPDRIKE